MQMRKKITRVIKNSLVHTHSTVNRWRTRVTEIKRDESTIQSMSGIFCRGPPFKPKISGEEKSSLPPQSN